VRRTKRRENSILWIEAFGFTLIIVLSWLTEALRIPHYLFGEPFAPDWRRAMLRTVVLLAIWAWVHFLTRRLLKRLPFIANSDFHKPKHIFSWKTLIHAEKDYEAIKHCVRRNEHVAITLYRDFADSPAKHGFDSPAAIPHFVHERQPLRAISA